MLTLAFACAALALAGAGWLARRQQGKRRLRLAMRRRLAQFASGEPPARAVPLQAPPGRVAVSPEGLLLALGGSDFRQVLWSDVSEVQPTPRGVRLHIRNVGPIAVPGALGRDIWKAVSAPASR